MSIESRTRSPKRPNPCIKSEMKCHMVRIYRGTVRYDAPRKVIKRNRLINRRAAQGRKWAIDIIERAKPQAVAPAQ